MVRTELARPLVGSLKLWLAAELHRVAPRSPLADAIRYALVRWEALCRFLEDGRVELDTNTVERAIRPIALRRKNHLFAGSDGGADRWAPPDPGARNGRLPMARCSARLKLKADRRQSPIVAEPAEAMRRRWPVHVHRCALAVARADGRPFLLVCSSYWLDQAGNRRAVVKAGF